MMFSFQYICYFCPDRHIVTYGFFDSSDHSEFLHPRRPLVNITLFQSPLAGQRAIICSECSFKRTIVSLPGTGKTMRVKRLSHINHRGEASMVDVSAKPILAREAVARGEIHLARATLNLIESHRIAKGNVLATARLAGILAAKRTGDLIPLCHPLSISHCEVHFSIPKRRDLILITASTRIAAQTGVEMEALTAVSVAALTIFDMCKAVDKRMRIGGIRLVSKTKLPLEDRHYE
jgi:cyclic pyranopterin phosphate synthase